MKILVLTEEALRNFAVAKLRTFLALLGVLVGTAAVVAMVLGGELATNEAIKQFQSLGTDLLAITITDDVSKSQNKTGYSLQDIRGLSSENTSILHVAPYASAYQPLQFNGEEINGSILGVTEEFQKVIQVGLMYGRFISHLDEYQFYCVIGNDVYQQIKNKSLKNPVGQQLQVGKNIFTIVGVAEPWLENSFVYADVDHAILIPLSTAMTLSKYTVISNILLQLIPQADINVVESDVEKYFSSINPNYKFFFRSAKEYVVKMKKQSEILTVFLGLVGGVSLLVGGIGIMNIMLVSVFLRRREIGIRMAIGATRADIQYLFLIEAMMLSIIGGGLGVMLGLAISYLIALSWHWQFTLFLFPPFMGFFVSAITGIFFGYYPAYKASQLDPISALKME